MEPTNEAALFDLAQSQSAILRTQCAIQTYQQLLDVNPCHTDAATALSATDSNASESDPVVRLSVPARTPGVGQYHLAKLLALRAAATGG